ncbi:DUF6020 family protein [Paenibacillus tepidiphilus]|uniref:DUF6020 family protein n=1 Tax=Paenibacillus tepidiphilus TaxID=2608683 RepID=UPI0012388C27|nr:DUF6020 family protein [Paenibacillus tepidiphilus]
MKPDSGSLNVKIGISILSLFFSLFIFNFLYQSFPLNNLWNVVILVILFFVFFLIFCFIFKSDFTRFRFNRKASIVILILSALLSLALATVMNKTIFIQGISNQQENVKVIVKVLGEKNKLSQGSEVWIEQLEIDGIEKDIINGNEVTIDEGWQTLYGSLESAQQGATFMWSGQASSEITLTFKHHPWSGKAEVLFNGEPKVYDLYNNKDISKAFHFDVSNNPIKNLEKVGLMVINSIVLIILIFALLSWVFKKSLDRSPPAKRIVWIYIAFFLFVHTVYFLVFFPGNMSADSLFQWNQAQTGQFSNWQPFFHTLLIWFITRIYNYPAIITLFQIFLMSIAMGITAYKLQTLGVRKFIIYPLMLYYALNPVNGMMSVTLWKDIPFAIFTLILVNFLINVYRTNYKWLLKNRNMFLMVFVLVFVGLLRHNGIASVFGVLAVLLLFYREFWKRNMLIASIIVVSIVLFKGPISKVMEVTPAPAHFTLALQLHQVGTMIHENVALSREEEEYFKEILPLESWNGSDSYYSKYTANYILFHPKLNPEPIIQDRVEFLKHWIHLVQRNPAVAIKDWMSMTSLIWQLNTPADGYLYTVHRGIDENNFGITQQNYLPSLRNEIIDVVQLTEKSNISWMFWRPALFLYCVIIFGCLLIRRNDLKAVIICSPVLFEAAGLMISTPAQDSRYFYSVTLVAPIIIILAFVKFKRDYVE